MFSDRNVMAAALVLFLLVYLYGAGLGVWNMIRITRLRRGGTRVPGNVVAVERIRNGRTWVRLSFRAVEGQAVETRFKVRNPRLSRGQRVTVAYNPAKPESVAVLESRQQLGLYVWMLALSTFALGVFGWAGYMFARSAFF